MKPQTSIVTRPAWGRGTIIWQFARRKLPKRLAGPSGKEKAFPMSLLAEQLTS